MWQAYEMPKSVEEALDILKQYEGRAQLIAGGTDLIIELQEGKHSADCLVDVTRIPGLDRIEREGDDIVMGANVTFRQIKDSALLREKARVLPEAAASVGALQIQTVATLAGNVVSALPAADGCVALLALEAEVEIVSLEGRRWRPVGELFLGPGRSAVDPRRQMITKIRFPVPPGRYGTAWERIGRRRALVLPILNCAVNLSLTEGDGKITRACIGLGPVAPVPFRAMETEAFLRGRAATEEIFRQAGEIASGEAKPRTSVLRASKEYRSEVLKVLVRQGLERAAEEARGRR
ncbi:MAG: FAD binding domain-containing protein [Anaerolineae bacterium]|jgi:carbon-monoxide dehydrogenase medium subunit